jgi:hypothetical protein
LRSLKFQKEKRDEIPPKIVEKYRETIKNVQISDFEMGLPKMFQHHQILSKIMKSQTQKGPKMGK